MKHHYEIVVGNIGTVYSGHNHRTALQKYNEYIRQSQNTNGRAAGETVTFFYDGEIDREYIGEIDQKGNDTAETQIALANVIEAAKGVNKMTIRFELTDLFGGEANYSWVRRHEFAPDKELSDRALVMKAKAWAGLTGIRCRTESYGDMIRIDASPGGLLHVLFITFE